MLDTIYQILILLLASNATMLILKAEHTTLDRKCLTEDDTLAQDIHDILLDAPHTHDIEDTQLTVLDAGITNAL